MFTQIQHAQSVDINSLKQVVPPQVFAPSTIELRSGLYKAIAAFTVVNNNCTSACNSALETAKNSIIDFKTQQQLDSCVRRCFVQRLKAHLPEDNQLTEFVYASAFDYKQEDLFHLTLNDVGLKPAQNTSKFSSIENVAKSFNSYFI